MALMVKAQYGIDVTSLLSNPDFENGTEGWIVDGTGWSQPTATTYGYSGTYFMESWIQSGGNLSDLDWAQTIEVPNGVYAVRSFAHSVQQGDVSLVPSGVVIYANGDEVPVTTSATNPPMEYVVVTVVTDGTLTIGYRITSGNVNWTAWDNIRVYRYSAETTDEAKVMWMKDEMNLLKEDLEYLVESPMKAELRDAISESFSAIETVETFVEAEVLCNTIKAQADEAQACVVAYEKLNLKIEEAYEVVNNGVDADELFKAVSVAQSKYDEESLDASGALAEIEVLSEAIYTYEMSIADGSIAIDVTEKYMTNPTLRENSKGWSGSSPGLENEVMEFYDRDFDMYQVLTGIPNGKYVVKVQGFYRETVNDGGLAYAEGREKITAKLYANSTSVPLLSLYKYKASEIGGIAGDVLRDYVNMRYSANMAFNTLNPLTGQNYYEENVVAVIVKDGTLKIGLHNEGHNSSSWCAFRDFKLYYYGDFSAYFLTEKIGEIREKLDENKDVMPSAVWAMMDELLRDADRYTEKGAYSNDEVDAVIIELDAKLEEAMKAVELLAALKVQVADIESNLIPLNYPGEDELLNLLEEASAYFDNDCKENTYEGMLEMKSRLDEGIITYFLSQEASLDTPVDYTFFVPNPNFEEKGNWTWTVNAPYGRDLWIGGCRPTEEGEANRQGINLWAWGITSVDVHQVLTGLPNGLYKVSAELITQTGYATDQHVYAAGVTTTTSDYLSIAGWDTYEWETLVTNSFATVVDGTLTIGAASSQGGDGSEGWFQATNFKLYYYGEADVRNMGVALKNADMEEGLKYWGFDGVDCLGRNTKNPSVQIGYHGMNKGVQEAWHSNPGSPLGDSYIKQRVSNLPNGTYVFGAYAAAARQYNSVDICERVTNGGNVIHVLVNGKHQYSEYWSNRDSINGVALFANDATAHVATDNPDLSDRGCFFGHSSKFNVATQVTDGTIEVGLRVEGTNANYVVWDNATLYYFGTMSEAEALDAMAEIDMTNAAAIADTLVGYKMNVDTLANLKTAIAASKAKTSTAATLWDDSEALHQAAALARKSVTDYTNLKKNIESAKLLTDPTIEWSKDWTPNRVALLEEAIVTAEVAYETAELDRDGLTALRKELNWTAGDVHVDSVYAVWNELAAYNFAAAEKVNQPGGITQIQLDELKTLESEIADTIAAYEAEIDLPVEEKNVNPNGLLPYIARVKDAIRNVKDNPISTEYTKMPIQFNRAENNWIEGAEWFDVSKRIMGYTSPLYRFEGKIENFRITVKSNKNQAAYFCLSKLEFFDGNGQKIELTEDNISSNADHNSLNGTPDGGGFAALFDEDNNSFFHSAWQNAPAEAHYLEVTLPNGGYDAFSFRMLGRSNSNGWDQSHTFPGEMVISTPTPKRDALEALINEAKALNVYSLPEVGFYVNDFSFLTDELAKAEALLATWPSEDEADQARKDLQRQILRFKDSSVDKSIHLPKAGVGYRIVSGFPGFYEKQFVEKTLTVNAEDKTLWWEDVCADSPQQVFMFDPILDENGEPSFERETIENYDGTIEEKVYYHYTIKNVAYDLYVDGSFRYVDESSNRKLQLVEQPVGVVKLVSLGRGQWNIIVDSGSLDNGSYSSGMLHTGDHNSGTPSTTAGAYGGTYGIGSGIVSWSGGIDSQSAWFIREYPELPLTVLVKNGEYKSDFIHFQADNVITLTADKACAFADLALYDLYGNAIEVADVAVLGNTATISTENNIVGCAFAFTNNEGVTSVTFDAKVSQLGLLQEALDEAVAIAPIEGTEVMQYADLSVYNAAIAKAENMLANGAADAEIRAMIAELEAAVANLVPNMPAAGKSYYIFSGLEAFEDNHGYKMAIYTKESKVFWANENEYEQNRRWQFVPATEDELMALGVEDAANVKAYYIKNVSNGLYIGKADGMSTQIEMVTSTSLTLPYVITALQGNVVAIQSVKNAAHRLHGAGHGNGRNKNGTIVYWNSGLGTSSAWRICGTETYLVNPSMSLYDIDALTRETVNIPIEMECPEGTTSFQFDLYLPDGVTVSSASLNAERAIDHVMTIAEEPNGSWHIEAHSAANAPFIGTHGVIVNLSAKVHVGTAEGVYSVALRDIRMGQVNGDDYFVSDCEAAMKVTRTPIMGDVNDDDHYTMSDVVMTVNALLGIAQNNFNAAMADVNGDCDITIGDVISILRMVLTGELPEDDARSTARRMVSHVANIPTLGADDCVMKANNRMVMPISLNNTCEYTAFQMDVVLPAGVELVKATLSDRAKNSHAIAWNKLSDGSTRVVAYALNNATFEGREGTLLNLELDVTSADAEDKMLTLTNGFFTTPAGVEDGAAELSVPMRIGSTGIKSANADSSMRIYGVEGAAIVESNVGAILKVYAITGKFIKQVQVMEGKNTIVLPAGMYVINGNKVIVK